MSWFRGVFGFPESRKNIERYLTLDGPAMHSSANDRTLRHGVLTTPMLGQLRARAAEAASHLTTGSPTVREVVGDAHALHADPTNAGALFQVASQCNLLEMVGPSVRPSAGITGYEADPTQGPACAIACAAGTLYRNWIAQTTDNQIDTLAAVGGALGNDPDHAGRGRWWTMRNGYALLTGDVPTKLDDHHDQLAIGLQTDTEVTLSCGGHLVTQAYCSGLPVSYSSVDPDDVESLARLVLNSAYEATLAAAVLNAVRPDGSTTVFLTLLGGGAFGNPTAWIVDAIARAITRYRDVPLDIAIVSYRQPNPALAKLLA